jgi:hypothetical protein
MIWYHIMSYDIIQQDRIWNEIWLQMNIDSAKMTDWLNDWMNEWMNESESDE